MLTVNPGSSRRTRLLAWSAAAGVVAALAAVLFVPVGSSPQHSPMTPSPLPPTSSPAPSSGSITEPGGSRATPALRATDDPAAYAREVAAALFDVRPAATTRAAFIHFWHEELPNVVYSDAASKGLTLKAQNADVIDNLTAAWIPTQPVWTSEAAEQTTNSLMVTSVSVPDYWVNAVADGTFRDPGLRMERVMGVLTQSYGTDPSHRATTRRTVVIDLGLLCGPTQSGGCRLLAPQQPPGPDQS